MNLVMPMRQQNDELNSRRHAESSTANVRAAANWDDKLELLGRIDQVATTAKTASAHAHEIKIDKSHRVLDFDDDQGVRLGLIVGALVASTGLTLFAISALPLPFAPPSGSGSRSSVNLEPSSRILASKKEDRLPIRGTIIRGVERQAPAQLPANPSPWLANNRAKLSQGAATTVSSETRAGEVQTPVKLTPAPETRPTTIEGWTLRDVSNGTAVLEGPDGIRRVTRGDTIPGVGRVESIFRWGNRLIVATSKGLISTP
jgi:hypothetical protein